MLQYGNQNIVHLIFGIDAIIWCKCYDDLSFLVGLSLFFFVMKIRLFILHLFILSLTKSYSYFHKFHQIIVAALDQNNCPLFHCNSHSLPVKKKNYNKNKNEKTENKRKN